MQRTVVLQRRFELPHPPAWAWEAFMRLAWDGGAGIGPRPHVVEAGNPHGIGRLREIPVPGTRALRERIEEGVHPRWVAYRVVNPGWPTFPVRRHRGTLTFEQSVQGTTIVTWTVEFEPLRFGRWPATWLTSWVMHRYAACLVRASRDEDSTSERAKR